MNFLFPKIKISLGKKPITKPNNPFTIKKISIPVPALKTKAPRIPFSLRSPFVKR